MCDRISTIYSIWKLFSITSCGILSSSTTKVGGVFVIQQTLSNRTRLWDNPNIRGDDQKQYQGPNLKSWQWNRQDQILHAWRTEVSCSTFYASIRMRFLNTNGKQLYSLENSVRAELKFIRESPYIRKDLAANARGFVLYLKTNSLVEVKWFRLNLPW